MQRVFLAAFLLVTAAVWPISESELVSELTSILTLLKEGQTELSKGMSELETGLSEAEAGLQTAEAERENLTRELIDLRSSYNDYKRKVSTELFWSKALAIGGVVVGVSGLVTALVFVLK